jgi:hypothetical protein
MDTVYPTLERPALYRPRNARASPLYQLFQNYCEDVKAVWEERFEKQFGFWRGYERGALHLISSAESIDPFEPILHQYDCHLRDMRGLVKGSRAAYLRYARRLLDWFRDRCGDRPLAELTGVDLTTIKSWLGHASVNTTHQYVEADLEM